MTTAVFPQIRVEPKSRAALDSVLLPGEAIDDFVDASLRRAVEFRRSQADFAARHGASLAKYELTETSVPSDVVLSDLEAKVAFTCEPTSPMPSNVEFAFEVEAVLDCLFDFLPKRVQIVDGDGQLPGRTANWRSRPIAVNRERPLLISSVI